MKKASWASVVAPVLAQASLAKQKTGRRQHIGAKPDVGAKIVAALAKASPGRAQLFQSLEFRKAVDEIVAHEEAAEALARLCNALEVNFVTHSAANVLRGANERPHIIKAAHWIRKASKSLQDLRADMTARTYREDLKTAEGIMIPQLLEYIGKELERIAEKYGNPSIPGLDGSSVGQKHGVTLAAAVPTTVAREVVKALPPSLRSKHTYIASLLNRAGIKATPGMVKSAARYKGAS